MKRIRTIVLSTLILFIMLPGIAAADTIEDVRITIRHWNSVWNLKKFDKLLAFYSPSFKEGGYTYDEWKAKTDGIFYKAGDISFTADDIYVFVEGRRATVSFVQEFKNASMPPRGLKTLGLEMINDQWKIVSGKWEALESAPPKSEAPKVATIPKPSPKVKTSAKDHTVFRPNRGISTYPYTIQVGSYPTKAQAYRVVDAINVKGGNAFFALAHIAGKGDWYRVFVGYYTSEAEAFTIAERLKQGGTGQANIVKRPYTLQIGSFLKTDQALISKKGFLKAKGYIGYIVADKYEPDKIRLLTGAYKTRNEAARRVKELSREGIKSIVDLR
ncbi:SPOR domain-containing protein [Desulfococcaceae bacterium HSG9]|nr:SPOR domain-containing protein [Desulfococcaceae bacterium HSG9]